MASAVAGLLLAAWLVTGHWTVTWHWGTRISFTSIQLARGAVCVLHEHHQSWAANASSHPWGSFPGSVQLSEGQGLWWMWQFEYRSYLSSAFSAPNLVVPLWAPLLVTAVLAAGLWYLDRGPPRGACPHCGYDLSGVSGTCPECGRIT